MICKRCQTELADGSRFCPTCGALQPMICPTCGAESRPGSKTCSACGKKLPLVDRPDKLVYTRRPRRTGELVAMFAVILGALAILGGAIWFLLDTVDFGGKEKPAPVMQEEQQPEAPPVVVEPEQIPVEPAEKEEEPAEEEPAVEEEQPAEEVPEEEQPTEETPAEEAPAEEEQPEAEEPAADQWFFPDSSERRLTEADIAGMSSEELRYARNEIYARHGRRFSDPQLQAYFDSCAWYEGTIDPANFSDTMLSEIEMANVAFLKAAE